MNDESAEKLDDGKAKELVASRLYFSSLYFISVGVLYLWGYWPHFSINILEYVDFGDILKLTAYPVAISAVVALVGVSLGSFATPGNTPLPSDGEHRERKSMQRKARGTIVALVTLYLSAWVLAIWVDDYKKWLIIPSLLTAPLALWAAVKNVGSGLIPNERLRLFAIFMIFLLPFLAYGVGRVTADAIVKGRKFTYLLSDSPDGKKRTSRSEKIRYLGHAGDFMFFYDPLDSSTMITKINDEKPIVLKEYSEPDELTAYLKSININ